ncbi:hypothetical protein [Mesorhizobium sp.]|uniref:hypothetical protein n=1 Tax=Mesorhizobium sp. TaxID=1871066 RepID=UPI00257C1DFA|nr:hypothetical protein [Mesorhizobium sp.]
MTHPTFAWMLLEHLSAQLRRMTERVFEYSTLVVRKRLIVELLHRAEKAAPVDGEVSNLLAPSLHLRLALCAGPIRDSLPHSRTIRNDASACIRVRQFPLHQTWFNDGRHGGERR